MQAPKVVILNEMSFRNISNLKSSLLSKKTYITHQIQFSFARRVGSQTLFMWQSYYKSKPILLISGVQPNLPCWQELRNIWGRKLSQWIFIHISSEQHGMGPGEQQNQEFFDAVEVSAHLLGVEPAASPLQNISNRTLVPNPAPCAPKSPPCSSHSPLHRYSHTFSFVGCSQQKFGDEHQDQRDECIFCLTEQA